MQSSVHTSSVFLQEFDAVFGAQEGAALLEKFPLAAAAAQQLHRTAPTPVARDAWGQHHLSQLPHRALHVSRREAAAPTNMGAADEPASAAQTQLQQAQDQLRLALQQLNRALEATGSAEAADVEGELSIELSGGLAGSELGFLSLAAGWAQSAALILAVKLSFELDRGAW